ncbi:MAG TPA: hypothetical protein VKR99_08290 [Candidatus Eremiobacteraceae bacterium]|nr:hypothetical protein [Candidatus Eremiobacteraceae bacterium]
MINADEIAGILKQQIKSARTEVREDEVGTVIEVGDSIARVYGLSAVEMGELVQFPNGLFGIAFNLEEDNVGVVVLGTDEDIKEGATVRRTGHIVSVPVGDEVIGRVVNPLGQPLDDKGPVSTTRTRPIETQAPTVVQRQAVSQPLQTGIKAIDGLVPIGKGQRELIIGDRQTGKTALAIDAIINQRGKNVICIYVAIGQKTSTVAQLYKILTDAGAMEYTTIVAADSSDPASLRYIAPYAGCAMGQELMYAGRDVLIVYDDLSKHAQAYREISLVLRRPPGREAYRRHLLLALTLARARRQAFGRARRRLHDCLADHRDAARRRVRLHPHQPYLDHRRPDLPRNGPVLQRHPAGDRRRAFGFAGRRCSPDQSDEGSRRTAAAGAVAISRLGRLLQTFIGPRQSDAGAAVAR